MTEWRARAVPRPLDEVIVLADGGRESWTIPLSTIPEGSAGVQLVDDEGLSKAFPKSALRDISNLLDDGLGFLCGRRDTSGRPFLTVTGRPTPRPPCALQQRPRRAI